MARPNQARRVQAWGVAEKIFYCVFVFSPSLARRDSYRTLEEAAAARKAAEEEYFGAFLEAIGQGK